MKLTKTTLLTIGMLFTVLSFTACKKVKESIAMNFLISAMTDGRWLVNTYTSDNIDETADFEGYEFQFEADGKVYAYKDGVQKAVGTWKGDIDSRTIVSNFPGAGEPLIKLNNTFKIINNTTKLVEAKPLNESINVYLKLVKK